MAVKSASADPAGHSRRNETDEGSFSKTASHEQAKRRATSMHRAQEVQPEPRMERRIVVVQPFDHAEHEFGLARLIDAEVGEDRGVGEGHRPAVAVIGRPKLHERAVAHGGAVLRNGMIIFHVIFRRHAPQADVGDHRPAAARTGIDRAGDGEFHRRHVLQRGMPRPGRLEMLMVAGSFVGRGRLVLNDVGLAIHIGQLADFRAFVAEQQIVAEDEAHRPGHVVHDGRHAVQIRMIADEQHAAAASDEFQNRFDFFRRE